MLKPRIFFLRRGLAAAGLLLGLAAGPVRAQTTTPAAVALPTGVARVTAVEGITEYQLKNGLRVLLFPDQSKPTMTVNVTYLVGSRHEGYGESGMAHLLEHMLFKGSTKHTNIPQELTEHGASTQRHHLVRPHQLLRDICLDAPTTSISSGRSTWRPTAW